MTDSHMMPSDPSFGTTGFFSYLWTPRKPVYDVNTDGPGIVDNTGINAVTTNNGAYWVVLTNDTVQHIVRWV